MSSRRLFLTALTFLAISSSLMGEPATPIHAWSTIWLPWYEAYSSWDWRHLRCPVAVQPFDGRTQFPDSVQKWKLDVCSISNPSRQAFAPLPLPPSLEAYSNNWKPGCFPVSSLEALGEGTFLCAVVGDGRRYSNVSRVTIDHSASSFLPPQMRILGIPSPQGDIRDIGFFVVPAQVSVPQVIRPMDVTFPYLSVEGTWSEPLSIFWEGQNPVLGSGEGWGAIIPLDNNYAPAIKPFKTAHVQVRIVPNLGVDRLKRQQGITPKSTSPEYLSPSVFISIHFEDERKFDRTFGVTTP